VCTRYHRTLKDVGLSPRMSAGTLIETILKVNRVQIRKSQHADFEQHMKTNVSLPAELQVFDQCVLSSSGAAAEKSKYQHAAN